MKLIKMWNSYRVGGSKPFPFGRTIGVQGSRIAMPFKRNIEVLPEAEFILHWLHAAIAELFTPAS